MAKLGKILGSISPLAGALTGKGVFGKGMAAFEDATGMGGVLPKLAQRNRNRNRVDPEDPMVQQSRDIIARGGMKKGGKVKKMATGGSASKRADGIAKQGRTKGKFV